MAAFLAPALFVHLAPCCGRVAVHSRQAVAAALATRTPLERWLSDKHGVRLDAARVAEAGPGRGRGLFAASACGAGEVLFEIPLDACIAEDAISREPGEFGSALAAIVSKGGKGGWVVATTALLLKERGLGSQSRWAPYIASLPWDDADSVLDWSADELSLLRGSSARAECEELQREVGAATALLFAVFRRLKVPAVLRADGQPQSGLDLLLQSRERAAPPAFAAAVRAAFSLVLSRSFELPGVGDCALVPLLDMANSADDAADAHVFCLDEQGRAVQLVASAPIGCGAEVLNSYGEMSLAERLVYFGYLPSCALPSDCPPSTGAPHRPAAAAGAEEFACAAPPEALGVRLRLPLAFDEEEERDEGGWKRALLGACGREDELERLHNLLPPTAAEPVPAEARALLRLGAADGDADRRALQACADPWALLLSLDNDEATAGGEGAAATSACSVDGLARDALEQRAVKRLARVCADGLEAYGSADGSKLASAQAAIDPVRAELARQLVWLERGTLCAISDALASREPLGSFGLL